MNLTPTIKQATLIFSIISIVYFICLLFLGYLVVRALLKYIHSKDIRQEKSKTKKSLGEVLKNHRILCGMTQEFVAEAIGVSRQAVSKWKNGTSDPSTSNLISLAKLFDVTPEILLQEIKPTEK
ncbi:MAG: helix-turn-helix domain-containing protein [Clostridia bacterium]|nr:helix-turn-helix domain-containing protein [Clostridia bacterium]